MPYLELANLHEADIETRLKTPVSLFYCPSCRPARLYLSRQRTVYSDSESHGGLSMMAKSDYAANCGTVTSVEGNNPKDFFDSGGLIFRLDENTKVDENDVFDGTSNTILVGERQLNLSYNEVSTPVGDDDDCYLGGHNYDTLRCYADGKLVQSRQNLSRISAFGSVHAGACGFVFADGHYGQVSYSVNPDVYKCLLNRMDGEAIDGSKF